MESQLEEVQGQLVKIQITHLIKFSESFAGIEIHISVNGKYVKLNYKDEQFTEILRRLQQKELTEVFILPGDFQQIISKAQESVSAKSFYDPKTVIEDKMAALESSTVLAKVLINQLGADAETLKLLKTVNVRAMSVLAEVPSVFVFVKKFRKNCSDEFLRTMLTSYVMSLIIDKFPWKSDPVKEKGALASLLCDIVLEKDDFALIEQWQLEGTELPERIKRHPMAVSDQLRKVKTLVPIETLTIIEQHHELPDGTGFPLGITGSRVNQLSAIFIISQQFVEHLFRVDFDFEKRLEVISWLQKRYDYKCFEKAISALISITEPR